MMTGYPPVFFPDNMLYGADSVHQKETAVANRRSSKPPNKQGKTEAASKFTTKATSPLQVQGHPPHPQRAASEDVRSVEKQGSNAIL